MLLQDREFELSIKLDSISLEDLLITAIRLHIFTNLKKEEASLRENQLLCRVPSDIRIKTDLGVVAGTSVYSPSLIKKVILQT